MGLLMSASSLLLFESYHFMDAGVASTILFVYPVMVAVIMAVGFHERLTAASVLSIALACAGISLLYKGGDGVTLNLTGVVLVFFSALSYAVYIVGVNRSSLRTMSTEKLTFYCLLFGSLIYVVRLRGCTELQPVPEPCCGSTPCRWRSSRRSSPWWRWPGRFAASARPPRRSSGRWSPSRR